MKLAILLALAADQRSGHVLTPQAVPYDQALEAAKALNDSRDGPAPVVQLWTTGGLVKSYKFATYPKDWDKEVELPKPLLSDEQITELTDAHKAAVARIGELEGLLAERGKALETGKAELSKLEASLKTHQAAVAEIDRLQGLLREREESERGLKEDITKLEEQLKEAAAAGQSQVPGAPGQGVKGAPATAKGGTAPSKPSDKA